MPPRTPIVNNPGAGWAATGDPRHKKPRSATKPRYAIFIRLPGFTVAWGESRPFESVAQPLQVPSARAQAYPTQLNKAFGLPLDKSGLGHGLPAWSAGGRVRSLSDSGRHPRARHLTRMRQYRTWPSACDGPIKGAVWVRSPDHI